MPRFMAARSLPTKAFTAQTAFEHPANRFIYSQKIIGGGK